MERFFFCQTWRNNAMVSLVSRLKTHRKSVEQLEKEDLFRRKAVHLYEDDLWNAVLTATKEVSSNEIECLTSSMDQRFFLLSIKIANICTIDCSMKPYWRCLLSIILVFKLHIPNLSSVLIFLPIHLIWHCRNDLHVKLERWNTAEVTKMAAICLLLRRPELPSVTCYHITCQVSLIFIKKYRS